MIELCIDARMSNSSGIGTCIRQLAPLLNTPPFRVILLVDKLNQSWASNMEQICFSAPIYSIREQLEFPIRIPKCDLFWSPHYNVPILPIRAKKRVVTIHDACHLALSQYLSLAEKLYARWVMRKALFTSDAVITDSVFSKLELSKYFRNHRKEIKVVSIGVNYAQFYKSDNHSDYEKIKQKYKLPKKYILFVGNLKPHKNLEGLIRAFEQLSLPDEYGLAVVGRSKNLRNSYTHKEENRRIFFLGEVPDEDLRPLYTTAQVLTFPSFYEGFGLPPLEAMCCGCPTIVSNVASLPEVCGDASLYVDPNNTGEISEAIGRVLKDEELRKTMIEKGLNRVKEFNWQLAVTKYRNLFEEVCFA